MTGRCPESGVNMFVNQKRLVAVAMAFLGLGGSSAFATPVTFYFGGEITRAVDTFGLLEGGVEVGDSFFGRYTFELDTPDSNPSDSNRGTYIGAISAISFRAGDLRLSSPGFGSTIYVKNEGLGGDDSYQVIAPIDFEVHRFQFFLEVFDLDATMLASDALLAIPPTLNISEKHRIGFSDQVSGVSVGGDLRLLSVVPEPATGVLAIIGGMVVMMRRRCKE